jgi:hypothetical protein
LANATLQFKDATIDQLTRTREQPRGLISGEVLHSSLALIQSSDRVTDEEDVIPGIVSVSQFKSKGVSINLAELYRRFRQRVLGAGSSPPSSESDAGRVVD